MVFFVVVHVFGTALACNPGRIDDVDGLELKANFVDFAGIGAKVISVLFKGRLKASRSSHAERLLRNLLRIGFGLSISGEAARSTNIFLIKF